jgi:hypothetical protein
MQRSLPILLLLLTLVCLLASVPAQAQLVPPIQLQFFNSAGTGPAASGFLCTTQSGGNVSQLTYQDQALTTPNQNPVRLNAAGRPVNGSNEVAIFLQQLNYRFTLYAAGTGNTCNGVTVGAQLKQVDGVNGVLVSGSAQIANLGLGAAADGTARLLVSQASNTATILIVNSSVSKNWGIYNITNGSATDLRFNESNASADRVTLQAGGNVGVGTTNPTETLHVNGTGRFTRIGLGAASDGSNLLQGPNGSILNSSGAIADAYVGPHAIGGATNSAIQLNITGAFSHTANGAAIQLVTTLSPSAGLTSDGIVVVPTFNKAGSGTHPRFSGIYIAPAFGAGAASITDIMSLDIESFAAPASTTTATALRAAAPTGATTLNDAAKFLKSDGSTIILELKGSGDILWGKPLVSLGGGTTPTLGTIGGSGPTSAAQNSWMQVQDSSGNNFWVPVWK